MAEDYFSPFGHPKGHMKADGTWVRNSDEPVGDDTGEGAEPVDLRLAISSATPDDAVLYTVPPSRTLLIEDTYWEITTSFTGGTSSTIGASASAAPATADGALLGGASGELAANLTVGIRPGTKGTALSGGAITLQAGTTIKFNKIASSFTAGAGFIRVSGRLTE